jgi:magnesium-transporting ATPase (P-type)
LVGDGVKLSSINVFKRREIIVAIMVIVTIIYVSEYYFAETVIPSGPSLEIQRWVVIMTTFALGIGIINSLRFNIGRVLKRETPNMYYSIILLAFFVITIIVGLTSGTADPSYRFLFNDVLKSGEATAATLVSFFVVSALFRSLRLKRIDTLVVLASIIFYALYLTVLGELVLPGVMTQLGDFTGNNVLMFGQGFAVSFFTLALALRVITGREKSLV